MQKAVLKKDVRKLIGKTVYALKKDGTTVSGKLVRISGNELVLAPKKGKQVKTSALIPLVLFDLLAVGTAPYAGNYAYGGYPGAGIYGPGYGGFPPYGGFW
ncbi:50S ribosomal protein L33 [Paenibacillus rigui]|uniref:50S ribosomal protein L33 n=1 Tax=Paenibacillus rigui TaxID=554312 RepID=A0A229UY12_9BACL|nr:50S ribosomal protein L33 [Paenibacillus rigui]OXM88377.1 50S ribosomal protein L33 [Paenibacillus rigui]